MKKIRLVDIAAAAGVGLTTAERVPNEKGMRQTADCREGGAGMIGHAGACERRARRLRHFPPSTT